VLKDVVREGEKFSVHLVSGEDIAYEEVMKVCWWGKVRVMSGFGSEWDVEITEEPRVRTKTQIGAPQLGAG
jgi:hypothetical protein